MQCTGKPAAAGKKIGAPVAKAATDPLKDPSKTQQKAGAAFKGQPLKADEGKQQGKEKGNGSGACKNPKAPRAKNAYMFFMADIRDAVKGEDMRGTCCTVLLHHLGCHSQAAKDQLYLTCIKHSAVLHAELSCYMQRGFSGAVSSRFACRRLQCCKPISCDIAAYRMAFTLAHKTSWLTFCLQLRLLASQWATLPRRLGRFGEALVKLTRSHIRYQIRCQQACVIRFMLTNTPNRGEM